MDTKGHEARQEAVEMRDDWSWAMSWFVRPSEKVSERREMQARLIEAVKAGLQDSVTAVGLNERYSGDSSWVYKLARGMFPAEWAKLGVHACTAVAYGLRYTEIMMGLEIDAREPMPVWMGEWAVGP